MARPASVRSPGDDLDAGGVQVACSRPVDPTEQGQADARLEEALGRRGLRDPRDPLRARLRAMRETPAFGEFVRYYEEELVPPVARGAADPVEAWEEFGRRLARASGEGREVAVDPSGRAEPVAGTIPDDRIVLYLPGDARDPPLPLRVPRDLSSHQEATLALLVEGRLRL